MTAVAGPLGDAGLLALSAALLDAETRYKAKNAIDTFVYRGGDAVAGRVYTAIAGSASVGAVALAGAGLAALWAAFGLASGDGMTGNAAKSPYRRSAH